MIVDPPLIPLAALTSARPVFLIVMGLALLLVAWRMTAGRSDWGSRLMLAGAGLLAFGYAVVLPLYAAKVIVPAHLIAYHLDFHPIAAFGWHVAKLTAMNGGWLLFGIGLAHRAGVFPARRRPVPGEPLRPTLTSRPFSS